MNQKCPIAKATKNVVQWVGHALDGNGFFHIPHAPFKSNNDKRTAKIPVALQLRIPCPSSWVWDVRQEESSFFVKLPTVADLQRIIMYGGLFLKEKKIHLNFESWTEEDEELLIPKVWFHIYRVPQKLRAL